MLPIKIDSRKVQQGDTFVAIEGSNVDGHAFIHQAVANGATKVIASKYVDCEAEVCIVEDTQAYLQEYLTREYSPKLKDLTLIGITGTNGKTTTCSFVYQLLRELGNAAVCIGTLGYMSWRGDQGLQNTTPDVLTLYNLLFDAKSYGCRYVVMEVSSHALVQGRLAGLELTYGGFTNLTLDHLDYHKTMENYLAAKVKILDLLTTEGKIVVNADDKHYQSFTKKDHILIGQQGREYRLDSYECHNQYTNVTFTADKTYQVTIPVLGKFNVYNYLMAVAIVHDLGCNMEDIIAISDKVHSPSGRCTVIPLEKGNVVIDFAHTPDAILKIITSFKEECDERIITVVGCGGDRDTQKRPMIGQITTQFSDFVYFTNDNPRTEDPMKILKEIEAGVVQHNYKVIPERQDAIYQAIESMETGDTVLILGKGHEENQIIGTIKIPFNDIKEVEKYRF